MRFLGPNEVPASERKRRQQIQRSIKWTEKRISQLWKREMPVLKELAERGAYVGERFYAARVREEDARLREELKYYQRQLPPHMEYSDGGFLYLVPAMRT